MEESLNMFKRLTEGFSCGETDIRSYSPLTLAYIGDGIYDLIIRSAVVGHGNLPASKLHKKVTEYVNAAAQAAMIEAILENLSEEEEAIYKRGRNAQSFTKAKNASTGDYRKATGFEALMGYLYLQGRTERAIELTRLALKKLNMEL